MRNKTIFLLSFIIVILTSCEDRDFKTIETKTRQTIQKRSLDEALQNADNVFAILSDSETKTNSRSLKNVNILGSSEQLTKSGTSLIDTMYYIVNYDNGYAILGADTRLLPVYAICDEGEFNLSDSIDHPGVKIILTNLNQRASEIKTMATTKTGLSGFNDYEWSPIVAEQILHEKFGPFGKHRKWGQGRPFNKYCFTNDGQQAYVGCVAVATALVMAHHKHPNSILGYNLDWSEMDGVKGYGGSPQGVESLARLMASLGTKQYLQMNYGTLSSGANTKQRVPPTLIALGYNCGSNTNWTFEPIPDFMSSFNEVDAKLMLIKNHYKSGNNGPILMRANSYEGTGHAWIIDGYMHTTIKLTTHGLYPEQRYYYYCNWGWNGIANGWYVDDSFMTNLLGPNKGESDESYSTGNSDYVKNREMLIGITKN